MALLDVDVNVNISPDFTPVDMTNETPPETTVRTWGIADLAREFGITTRTIRFYEDRGLLSPSRQGSGGQTRVYRARDRTRLRLALRGKRLGLRLDDIRELLDMFETPADTPAQAARLLTLLDEREAFLRAQMADLDQTLAEIGTLRAQAQLLLDRHCLVQHVP